jgi:hypothetical protein
MSDASYDSLPEWTEEELAVLRSADDDRPPTRSLPATLAAVGVGGALASGAAAAKGASVAASVGSAMTTAKWGTFVVIAKWAGALALSGAVVTGGVVLLKHSKGGNSAATASEGAQVPSPRAPMYEKALTAPSPALAVPETPSPMDGAREPGPPNPLSRRLSVRSQPDISLEIAALDEARTALRAGRTTEALGALDRYDTAFARGGSLRVEATALRIEALLRAGSRARATSLAHAFLARNPKSPYAARVRALIGENSASE